MPKFALLTFEVFADQYDKPTAGSMEAIRGNDSKYGWVRALIEKYPDDCVRVDTGTFVMKTREAWGLLQAISSGLASRNNGVTVALFEGDLIGNYDAKTSRQLLDLGVQVLRITTPQTPPQ